MNQFLYQIFNVKSVSLFSVGQFNSACSTLALNSERRWFEPWMFVTYGFVHKDWAHFISNLILQLLFGLPLEMAHTTGAVACIYCLGVLGAGLTRATYRSVDFPPLVGASGGVYALITAHISSMALNWRSDSKIVWSCPGLNNSPEVVRTSVFKWCRAVVLASFIVADWVITYLDITTTCNGVGCSPATSYIAHLSGAICGFSVGLLVLKDRRRKIWKQGVKLAIFTALIIAFSYVVLSNIDDALEYFQTCDRGWKRCSWKEYQQNCYRHCLKIPREKTSFLDVICTIELCTN